LRVTDKHSRQVVCSQTHAPQPHGWTQAQIETKHRVRDREKAKITLPSPEHLKRIMRDAPSLEDVMKERTDGEASARSALEILRPDTAAEPELRIVRARDGVFDLGIAQHRQNWAELLLPDQSRIVTDVANNRRLDEIALALQNIAARNDNAVLFGILQEALHSLEMRLILQRPYLGSGLGAVIDDSRAGQPPEFLAEFVILRIMNVEALDHDAALAGVEGRAGEQLWRYFHWIDIIEHNGGVVAAELQREALQRAGRAFHDFPAGRSRARECDFGDVRMAGERVPKIVGVDNDVDHPRGQNINAQLTQFKRRQRGDALDWMSRPNGFPSGKVAALISASPGLLGGVKSQLSLQIVLTKLGVHMIPDSFALGAAHQAFGAEGGLRDANAETAVRGIGAALTVTLDKLAGFGHARSAA
jgi:hypothetical protein